MSGARSGIGSGRSDIDIEESEEKMDLREEGLSDVECNGRGTTALSASWLLAGSVTSPSFSSPLGAYARL